MRLRLNLVGNTELTFRYATSIFVRANVCTISFAQNKPRVSGLAMSILAGVILTSEIILAPVVTSESPHDKLGAKKHYTST